MRFAWNRAEAGDTSDITPTEPALSEPAPSELAAVELLTDEGRRIGWIATGGQRTSDWLNAHPDVPVHGLTDESPDDPAPSAAPAGSPEVLDRSRLIWVVPPPLPPNRHLRLHRRKVLVHLELDEWEISGQAHVRPGADATDQVLRGTREMIPLTDVQVASRLAPGTGAVLPVLIVNRAHVRRIVVGTPHQSAPVPEPVDTSDVTPEAIPVPDLPAGAPEAEAVEGAAEPSGTELLHSALVLLLETGVIDVVEFQAIRARIVAATPS